MPGRAGQTGPDRAGRSRQVPVARSQVALHPGRIPGPRSAPGWARGPGRMPGPPLCLRASGPPALGPRGRWQRDHRHRDHRHRECSYQDRWHWGRSHPGRWHLGYWHRAVGGPDWGHAWQQAEAACEGSGLGPAWDRLAHRRPDRCADRRRDRCADRLRDAIAGQRGRVAGPTMAAGRTAIRTTRPESHAAADLRPGSAGTRAAGPSLALAA